MMDDPCPMHMRFHTILGLMDAQDPLLPCVHNGRNHLPWLLHKLTLNPYYPDFFFVGSHLSQHHPLRIVLGPEGTDGG